LSIQHKSLIIRRATKVVNYIYAKAVLAYIFGTITHGIKVLSADGWANYYYYYYMWRL